MELLWHRLRLVNASVCASKPPRTGSSPPARLSISHVTAGSQQKEETLPVGSGPDLVPWKKKLQQKPFKGRTIASKPSC